MALERQSIEKKDFPIGRRGYDPDAVDMHLKQLADEVEELKNSSRRRTETLASTASDQVRAIVEAAESSAAEIQRQAEQDAQEIRTEAKADAQTVRDKSNAEARDYVGKVSESTASMLQRLDAMENELGALVESLRTGSNRLNADLALLENNLVEVRESVGPSADFEPEGTEPAPSEAAAEPAVDEVVDVDVEKLDEAAAEADQAPATSSENGGDDTEGARLIALNMALDGTPRDETDKYLSENFDLADRDGLLDEVYATVEG